MSLVYTHLYMVIIMAVRFTLGPDEPGLHSHLYGYYYGCQVYPRS